MDQSTLLLDLAGPTGAPVVLALTQAIKTALPRIPSRVVPLLAVGVGILLNVYIALATNGDAVDAVGLGIVAGLVAVGSYTAVSRLRGPDPASNNETPLALVR